MVCRASARLSLQALQKAHLCTGSSVGPQLSTIPGDNTTTRSALLCQKRFQVLLADSHSIANAPPGRYYGYTPLTADSNRGREGAA